MELLANIDNPRQLEKFYRENKSGFKAEFNSLYNEIKDHQLAVYWHERLNYEASEISWGSNSELAFVIFCSLLAGLFAKFPTIFHLNPEMFYPRNLGLIIFPVLTMYFIWRKNLSTTKIVVAGFSFAAAAFFINLLPGDFKSDTLVLSCIHLPLFLWAVFGFTFVGNDIRSYQYRLEFLRFNGDLAIMTGLILAAGGLLTGITISLFSVIGFHIETFYFEYIGIFGLAAAPIVAAYITQLNPQLINKVSPVIAKIFSPLVLIMLAVYLGAVLYAGKDPYNDRNFLMVFNLLLLGVMVIILFAVAESSKKEQSQSGSYILFALSIVTILVNGVALSAILFRISTWGITPNRLAVMGANILMLINLCMITYRLYKSVSQKASLIEVENSISKFLPVYLIWTIIVTFIFPFLFQFK
ncbi:MAG: hypothetical protein ABI763_15930 [Bacteroidota bacterium]